MRIHILSETNQDLTLAFGQINLSETRNPPELIPINEYGSK